MRLRRTAYSGAPRLARVECGSGPGAAWSGSASRAGSTYPETVTRRWPPETAPIRTRLALGLIAIALLAAGSTALVAWLTGAPGPGPARGPEPAQAAPAPPAVPLAAAPGTPPLSPLVTQAPEPPGPRGPAIPSPLARLDPTYLAPPPASVERAKVAGGDAAIVARVAAKCGAVRLESTPAADTREAPAPAELLLDVQTTAGQVRIARARVTRPGSVSPSQLACAQYALGGLVLPAPGERPGRSFQMRLRLGEAR